jgi:hypothetical protein
MPQQSPFIGLGPPDRDPASTKIPMFVEAFGGYDFRLCDGLWLPAVGAYGPPLPGYPGWDTPPVIVKFTIDKNDWIGQGEKKITIPVGHGSGDGQGDYSTTSGALDSGTVQWSGTIILSTETCSGKSSQQAAIKMEGFSCDPKGPAQTFSPSWGPFGARPQLNSTKTGSLALKCDLQAGHADYQFLLEYTDTSGVTHDVGQCAWPNGCNSAWFGWEKNDVDGNGDMVPACIDETHWISKDYGNNTLGDDGKSLYSGEPEQPPMLDWLYFDYDVFTNKLIVTDRAYAYAYGPPVPTCGDPALKNNAPEGPLKYVDVLPPLGGTTDAFLSSISNALEQLPPGVASGSSYSPADLTLSGTTGQTSAALFQTALGHCIPDALYNGYADLDNDGCNTLKDYQIWFSMYQPQGGAGSGSGNATPRIVVPATPVNVGDTFTVSIVADISDPVVGWGAAVAYSSTALQLNSVNVDPAWLQGSGPGINALTGLAFPNPVSGPGAVLATYSFTALQAGDTTLMLTVDPTAMMGGLIFASSDFSDYQLLAATVTVAGGAN